MVLKRLRLFNARLNIQAKITIPFVVSFMALWLSGMSFLGVYFSRKLRTEQIENVSELTVLVADKFEQELFQLRQQARLLGSRQILIGAVANQDLTALRQELLPLSTILDDDWIGVFTRDRQLLLEIRQTDVQGVELLFETAVREAVSGADITTLINSETQNLSLLIGAIPLKTREGIVGGLLLGKQLSGQLLSEVADELGIELIALGGDAVIAHSLDIPADEDLRAIQFANSDTIEIDQIRYFQASLPLEGISGEQVTLIVLQERTAFDATLTAIWLTIIAISVVGVGIANGVGYWVGSRLARPIRGLAEAANQVSEEANFGVRVAAVTQDELGVLARSLNQLIEWSGYYTHELELAAKTLDQRVQERTHELESALQELQETQLQLIQTEKMSSLGQMVAGIAHEINNPIGFIQGNVFHLKAYFQELFDLIQQYQSSYTPTPAIAKTIEDIDLKFLLKDTENVIGSIEVGTKRVKDIVIALRNFSRLDEAAIKDVDIHEGIESTLLILHHRLNPDVDVVKDYGELPPVRCYPAQLNQVFTNIIANAIDAMDESKCKTKQITITTRAIANEQIRLSFRDTGPGITSEIKQKIFDPFFTTKAVGKGTGLGLGICYQIVQKHSGHIDVASEANQGSEFIVTLPISLSPNA